MKRSIPPDFAIIAIGSNLGDSRGSVVRALELLQKLSDQPIWKSSLWETTPVDCPPDSGKFVNAIVVLKPGDGETPDSLLRKLQENERDFGRPTRREVNEPRRLDLDLIAFGAERRNSPQLTLPHPRARQRRFVLEPLCELDRDYHFPGETEAIGELLNSLPPDPGMRRLGPG